MSKNNRWTAQEIPDQTNRVAIVTGANSGIGYEAARQLALHGATVILACRNLEKGEQATQQINSEGRAGSATLMELDLADLASVRMFADAFHQAYDRLDLLINNAGVMMPPERWTTVNDFEIQFGTNHLGHFALTGLLLDLLTVTSGSRIVTVSSMAHRIGSVNFDDLQCEKSYTPRAAYGQSKIANLHFTYELQRRLEAVGIDAIANAAHPGWTATNLQQHSGPARLLNPFVAMQPEQGALPTLRAAVDPQAKGGEFYGPDGLMGMRGYPIAVRSNDRSYDKEIAAELWTVSEALTGVQYAIAQPI